MQLPTCKFHRPQINITHRLSLNQAQNNPRRHWTNKTNNYNTNGNIHIVVPYTKGHSRVFVIKGV